MKKWNTPVVDVIGIEETAWGNYPVDVARMSPYTNELNSKAQFKNPKEGNPNELTTPEEELSSL